MTTAQGAAIVFALVATWVVWTAIGLFRAGRITLANVEVVAAFLLFAAALILASPW